MFFVETTIFTHYIHEYLTEEEHREFQNFLLNKPDAGDIIQGTGGLRKIRWKAKGKRGGVRIIYYWQIADEQIYLLTVYGKNEKDDLTSEDKKILRRLIERWK